MMLYSTTGFPSKADPSLASCHLRLQQSAPRLFLRRFRVSAALVRASEMAAICCSSASATLVTRGRCPSLLPAITSKC